MIHNCLRFRKRRVFQIIWLAFFAILMLSFSPFAAEKNPTDVALNKKTATLTVGKTLQLKALLKPAKNVKMALKWKSSDPKVATVSGKGLVKAVHAGTAKIIVTTVNNKRAVCKLTVKAAPKKATPKKTVSKGASSKKQKEKTTKAGTSSKSGKNTSAKKITHNYKVTDKTVTFQSKAGTRSYRRFFFKDRKYPGPQSCVVDAVAFAVSGFGKKQTPFQLHYGSASKKGSEKHALKKLKLSTRYWNITSISVCVAAQMIRDMGIPAKAVYSFKTASAVKEISAHLKAGKPVILKCNSDNHAGHWIAQGHHTIVLLGLDPDGTVVFYDAMYNKLNFAHGSGTTIRETLSTLISKHTTPCKGKTRVPFVTSLQGAGGYILLG